MHQQLAEQLQYQLNLAEKSHQVETVELLDLVKQVQESHQTVTQRVDQLQNELDLAEERRHKAENEVAEHQDLRKQLREKAEVEAARIHDLREQLQDTDKAHKISAQQVTQLHADLALSEEHRLKAEAQIAKLLNLKKKQLQQRDENCKAAAQQVAQLNDELYQYRKMKDLVAQLQDSNMVLAISEK